MHRNPLEIDSKILVLMMATVTFGLSTATVMWIGFGQSHGLIHGMSYFETNFIQRLWPIVTLVIFSLALTAVFVTQEVQFRTMPAASSGKILRVFPAALVLGGVGASLLAVLSLRAIPFSADEYDYMFQAETFLRGRLWNPLLPGHEFFAFLWIVEKGGKWLSSFPPGWPLLLASGRLLGLPFWTVCPLLAATALVFLAKLAWREDGPAGAVMALALVVFSPFFAFNAGSFYSHVPTAAFGLMFCYFGAKFVDTPDWRSAALAGAALGMVGVIRPFDTVVFVAPFGLESLFRARRPHFSGLAAIVIGGLPCLVALLLYTHAITGSAFLPVPLWAYPVKAIGLNAVKLEGGAPVSMLQEVLMVKTRIWMLAEWTSPILVLAYLPAMAWKSFRLRVRFYDFILPTTVIAYLFFPDMGGDQYGPRYYFEGFMLMPVTIGSTIIALSRAREGRLRSAVAGLTTAHILTCLAGLAVLLVYMRTVVNERFDVYDQVRQAGLHNALVILDRRDIFARNGLDREGDVIYAIDLPGRIGELHRLFPDRQFFLYKRGNPEVHGELVPQPSASAPP
jgi:hypothetical protein